MAFDSHHDRVRRLFDDLVDLPEPARAERLSRAKGTDKAAAEEAERLLCARDAAGVMEPVFVFDGASEDGQAPPPRLIDDGETVRTPIGSVEIIRMLSDPARPGTAEVYEARHPNAGAVAIKVLRDTGTGLEVRRRFRLETEALRQLDHPNVARLLHAGLIERESSSPCIGLITRFVPGTPMDDWARGRSASEIALAMTRLARAVHHVHLRQILHRDIKPSNIIMTADDQPVLLDLGVAKFIGGERGEFDSLGKTVAGTLHYMAPEQLTPTTSGVDYRADIYALGVVLYELLTGTPMIDLSGSSEAEAFRMKQEARIAPPKGLSVLSLATQVAVIAASPGIQDRYESAERMADDLVRAIEGRPLAARPLGRAKRLALFVKRHPGPTVATTLVSAALIGSAASYMVSQRQVAAAKTRAEARFDDTRSFARWAIFELTDSLGSIADTTEARHGLIREASTMLGRLAEDPVAGPDLLLELAEGYTRLGELLHEELGDSAGALRSFAAAGSLLDRHPSPRDPTVVMLRAWLEFRSLVAIDEADPPTFEVRVLESCLASLAEAEPALNNDARLYRWRSQVLCHYSRRQLETNMTTDAIAASLMGAVRDGERAAMLAPSDAFARAQSAIAKYWLAHALYDRKDGRALAAADDAIDTAEQLARSDHPLAGSYLSRALVVRCWVLADRGDMRRFLEDAEAAIAATDHGMAREPNNKIAFRNADVVRVQLAKAVLDAPHGQHESLLRRALNWAIEAHTLLLDRQARGWTTEFENVRYPPSYALLVEDLRSALGSARRDEVE